MAEVLRMLNPLAKSDATKKGKHMNKEQKTWKGILKLPKESF